MIHTYDTITDAAYADGRDHCIEVRGTNPYSIHSLDNFLFLTDGLGPSIINTLLGSIFEVPGKPSELLIKNGGYNYLFEFTNKVTMSIRKKTIHPVDRTGDREHALIILPLISEHRLVSTFADKEKLKLCMHAILFHPEHLKYKLPGELMTNRSLPISLCPFSSTADMKIFSSYLLILNDVLDAVIDVSSNKN